MVDESVVIVHGIHQLCELGVVALYSGDASVREAGANYPSEVVV